MTQPISAPAVRALESALLEHQQVFLDIDIQGEITVRPLGVFSRLWHWNDFRFHEDRLSRLAAAAARILAGQQRLSIEAAAEDPFMHAGRNLLKEIRWYRSNSSEIDALKKQVLAAKLGIHATTLDCNPGLQQFTETHHLERYLLRYQDALKVDAATHQVFIRKDGKFCPWQQVLSEMQQWPKPAHFPQQAWVYGSDGIQHKDMYEWTELKPFKKGNPAEWHYQYVFEFCACYNPRSIKNGNHSWLRLKTPSGDIYSVGLYRPNKNDWTHNLQTPFRIKPGNLMQPDVSEFWPFKISTIDVAITEEDFLKMKQTIEQDKKDENLTFQLFNSNCLLYCKKIAAIGKIHIPTSESVLQLLAPESIAQRVERWMGCLPACVQKVCSIVAAFFLNCLQMCLGACLVDRNLNPQQKALAVPHIQSFCDLFDPQKTYLNHPNTLAFKIRDYVLDWRGKEIALLKASGKDEDLLQSRIEHIQLSLPPAFTLPLAS